MAGHSSNFKIVAQVELDLSTIQSQLNSLTGLNLGAVGQQFGMTFQQANMILHESLDIIDKMVDQVYELDSAMTEFKKISDLRGSALEEYVDNLAEIGREVGRTGSEMVEAATNFEKAGFGDAASADLAKIAVMLQNVADESIDAGDATDFLVSQLLTFYKSASEDEQIENAMHVADAVNEVAANFAVTTGDLISALPKTASALVLGNNTMEQTIGLTNRPIKNPLTDWKPLRAYLTKQIEVTRFAA